MAVDAPMTLAIARNSRRSILPALALSASDAIVAGTRSPLLLNMVIWGSPCCLAFSAITISHLARVVKDADFWRTVALAGRRRRSGRVGPTGFSGPTRPRFSHLQRKILKLIGKGCFAKAEQGTRRGR